MDGIFLIKNLCLDESVLNLFFDLRIEESILTFYHMLKLQFRCYFVELFLLLFKLDKLLWKMLHQLFVLYLLRILLDFLL